MEHSLEWHLESSAWLKEKSCGAERNLMFAHTQTILQIMHRMCDGLFFCFWVFPLHAWVKGWGRSQRHRQKDGVGLLSALEQILQWQLTWIGHYTAQNTGNLQSLTRIFRKSFYSVAKFNQLSMHHCPMIHSTMQWLECREWLIVVFNMSVNTHMHAIPRLTLPQSRMHVLWLYLTKAGCW